MSNFKNYTLKVNTDQAKTYFNAHDAILDNGFEYVGEYQNENPINGTIKKQIYKRLSDDKIFAFAGMSNYNTTIYYFKIREYISCHDISVFIY